MVHSGFGTKALDLGVADSEHLGPAYGACSLGCRFAILHGYVLGVFHFSFRPAFYTVCLHSWPPLLDLLPTIDYLPSECQ